ncbi:MAG: hypothetical protein IJ545_00365 [Alphaproteobacteria bacterium]|nr:hypothetical protein [Alphaproteobacteria bacterium]
MGDDTLNSNFEWKKKSFGKKERLSRGIDENQEALAESKKKNNFTKPVSLTAQPSESFNCHLKKMRKKIKQALDEDDEEETSVEMIDLSSLSLENDFMQNPLYNGLSEKEKKFISQKQTMQEIRMQQNAAKVQALCAANHFARKAGVPQMSQQEIAENMQNNGWGKDTFKRAVEKYISPDIKIGNAKLNAEKMQKLMTGMKRLQKMGGIHSVEGMKMSDVIKITDTANDDKRVAKLLLQKTGRKPSVKEDKKREKRIRQQQKVSFKKLLEQHKKQEQQAMKV